MPRKFKSWIDGFVKYTDGIGSPEIYRRWTAIFTIAAALERKIWTTTNRGDLFPNLFIFIVGPAAAGKTLAAAHARRFLQKLTDHHIAPSSISRASMIDALHKAERKLVHPQDKDEPIKSFNSLTIFSMELGVLIPGYENDFMHTLTDIYDNEPYSETRRTNKLDIQMAKPQLNLLAATTPSYLNHLIPEGAWDQGFLSRVVLVYHGPVPPQDLFNGVAPTLNLGRDLEEDLLQIGKLYGKFKFEEEAASLINDWHKAGGVPKPDHPRLMNYNSRRTAHLLKLCMIIAASSGDEPIITVDHFAEALDTLTEVEKFMPDIFKAMSSGGSGKIIEETYYFIFKAYAAAKHQPVIQSRVINFMVERVPAHTIDVILKQMEAARLIEQQLTPAGYAWKPLSKEV